MKILCDFEGAPEFEFQKQLYSTLILLGADQEIASLVNKTLDRNATVEDALALRRYNCELSTKHKAILKAVPKIEVNRKSS